MSDSDDGFFGLADGQILSSDGEDDGEVLDSKERPDSQTSTPLGRDSSPKVEKNGTAGKKVKRRKSSDESEEEGEASDAPGTPNSLDSAPMDESDSETEAPAKLVPPPKAPETYTDDYNEEDKYPYEGLFASAQEKEEIYSLSMLEREQIIADRSAEVERRRQNRLLRQLVSNQESEEKKQKKRKADSADIDDDESRKTTRIRKSAAVGTSAYDDLKRARAAKSDRMRMREEERQKGRSHDRRPSSRHSDFSDMDRFDHRRSRSHSPAIVGYSREPATLLDIEHVRVGRSRFAMICFYPGFEETMVGCFSRVSVGPDKHGAPVYKMAIIKEITKGKPYALQYRNTQIVTDQYAVLAHGKAVREWPFLMLSDGAFTEHEFHTYKQACSNDGVSLPKRSTLIAKVDKIDALLKRDFTPHELQEKLDRQNTLKRRFIPVDKERLRMELEAARAVGNETRMAEIQEKLDEASEAPRLAFRTSLAVHRTASNSEEQQRLAEINTRNRRQNINEIRAAQLREKHQMRALEAAAERGENVVIDQSRRLKTKAKFVHDKSEKDALLSKGGLPNTTSGPDSVNGSSPGTPNLGPNDSKKGDRDVIAQDAMERLRKKQQEEATKKGLPTISRPITGDDVIGALDLDLDIEI